MTPLRILVLHGPNLNLLGKREPEHYGRMSLAKINNMLIELGDQLGVEVLTWQSNHEGELVERVQQAVQEGIDGIVLNAAAYTHTSIALRDALAATCIPFVEVHLSNVYRREPFRHRSLIADLALGLVSGFGPTSYRLALQGLVETLANKRPPTEK